jgi:nicotinamide-nucleotide amidase
VRIEVICTGDELLTGLTTDTNSPYFMARLLELGERVVHAQTVGDVREEIVQALRSAAARARAVLVSGGLGPTADDLTAECAAAAAGVPLVEDQLTLELIRARFAKRGIAFTPNNARQALVPRGAEVVRNPVGTAPMFIQQVGGCTLFFVPGVPREYRALVDQQVLPRIAKLLQAEPNRTFRAFRLLKTVGLPESHLDALVAPLAKEHTRVIFGFRTHAPENHLKLLAEADTQAAADRALAEAEKDCEGVLKEFLFGKDQDSFAGVVGALLRGQKATLAVAESLTGGKIAELLTEEPGASDYFVGSAVTYYESLKQRWASVPAEQLARFGAVSKEVALSMAEGVRAQAATTYGLSVTGFAGPTGGTASDPVGTVYYALAGPSGSKSQRSLLPGDRDRVRAFAAYQALDLLRHHLIALGPKL